VSYTCIQSNKVVYLIYEMSKTYPCIGNSATPKISDIKWYKQFQTVAFFSFSVDLIGIIKKLLFFYQQGKKT